MPFFTPLVSIVTIFLNQEQFLEEAIESVRRQTTCRWELLLVDDGSSDGSSEIARRFAVVDPLRIRYLTHGIGINRGKSVSRNLGLGEARAEYVTFLDGDDVFCPQKIERQSGILEREPAAMVYGPSLYWHRWPGASPSGRADAAGRLGLAPDRIYAPPRLLTHFLREAGTVPCISGLTVRRTAALQVGGFDERIADLFEDQVFIAKICARFPVYVESGCWDLYRQHAASTSHQAIACGRYHPIRPNDSHRQFLSWLEEHVAGQQLTDTDLRAALARSTRPYRYSTVYSVADRCRRFARRAGRTIRRTMASGGEMSV
ncbi:MAG: glycosyltransferase [Rhodothermales bacterium]